MGQRTARKRRHETVEAAAKIHGSTNELSSSYDGMFDTLQKRCKLGTLTKYVMGNKKLTSAVISKHYKKKLVEFENSVENVKRSVATFYASGIMGKRKYQSVRLVLSMKSCESKQGKKRSISICNGCKVPKLLTYDKLVRHLKQIDVGTVHEIDQDYQKGLETEVVVNGAYRDLRQYLPMLAKFYLSKKTEESLKGFAESTGTFQIALGGDGCPFGKNESACSFLVSFMNVGRRVASSYDNFLIFGANCDESSPVVKKYVRSLLPQLSELERTEYEFEDFKYRFKLEELPNDMKMLAMLAGELTNSAKYFSSFGNVSTADCTDLTGTFGTENFNKWKPWDYKERVRVVNRVEAFKKKVALEKNSVKTKRAKITDFIAKQKSRQEFLPLLGNLIDKAHVEPLHLKNNAWQFFFKAVLEEALRKSKLPPDCKKMSEVPFDSCFAQVITALQTQVKTRRLANKTKQWFNETQGTGPVLQYRFTGKDSRSFCHNFMTLIECLSHESDSKKEHQTVLVLGYLGLRLSDCVSLCNRFDITLDQIAQLSNACREYFNLNALFMYTSVNPTVWTMGHIVPAHCHQVFEKYGQGLGVVTMEGREAKHIFLKKLSENTTYQNRWAEIFRHEFIMLIWLPQQGFQQPGTKWKNEAYIPSRVFSDPLYCYCGLLKTSPDDDKCMFCGDPVMTLIDKSVKEGKVYPQLIN